MAKEYENNNYNTKGLFYGTPTEPTYTATTPVSGYNMDGTASTDSLSDYGYLSGSPVNYARGETYDFIPNTSSTGNIIGGGFNGGYYSSERTVGLADATKTAKGTTKTTGKESTYRPSYAKIGTLPTLTYDKFTAPERDENRVSNLRMKASGAGLRELRRQTQMTVQSASGLDPTMRRMTLKDALMGYGSGVSKVMGQADQSAQRQYESEYQDKYKESMINYSAGISKANTQYQAELQKLVRNAGLDQNLSTRVINYTV
jgi:hypothetical protein